MLARLHAVVWSLHYKQGRSNRVLLDCEKEPSGLRILRRSALQRLALTLTKNHGPRGLGDQSDHTKPKKFHERLRCGLLRLNASRNLKIPKLDLDHWHRYFETRHEARGERLPYSQPMHAHKLKFAAKSVGLGSSGVQCLGLSLEALEQREWAHSQQVSGGQKEDQGLTPVLRGVKHVAIEGQANERP